MFDFTFRPIAHSSESTRQDIFTQSWPTQTEPEIKSQVFKFLILKNLKNTIKTKPW